MPGGKKVAAAAAGGTMSSPQVSRGGMDMEQLVIDDVLRAKLRNLSIPLELQDENGHILGHFTPSFRPTDADELMKTCPYTDDELDQFEREPGGRSLAEIWKDLGRTA
jgi:hypothetical protein